MDKRSGSKPLLVEARLASDFNLEPPHAEGSIGALLCVWVSGGAVKIFMNRISF